MLQQHAKAKGYTLDIFYTESEGEAISRIYEAADSGVDGLVMNPAGFNYAGYALRDCVKGTGLPYVEIHMTNIERRGIPSVLASVANGVIFGFGVESYILGLDAMLHILSQRDSKA
jgi:3-dehydroquinate dehydratase-2